MESKDEIREQLRAAERAAAAPYVDYPKDPWWTVPGFGALASLIVLGVNLREQSDMPDWAATLPLALVAAGACGYVLWQRRRRGTMPSGKAPREVNRVLWGFVLGAVVVAVVVFVFADLAPLWLAVPSAFVLASGGMLWFGRAYDRAAAQARERLR
ncbi:MAG: hypothetical protein GEV10_31855 [Streptosporangiales bacterium]|nr:hypothetical protein [Streptosporangiales bacterium]